MRCIWMPWECEVWRNRNRLIVTWDVFEWVKVEEFEEFETGLIVTWDVFECNNDGCHTDRRSD